ncbi:MAG: two-component system chemotaxis sensor kinase CheA [Halocynthiibacter sp.]|jgi:two-component system chemotaxis sensor kinase CheA
MSDPMAEIRASFFVECEELLESLQDGLQAMDDGEDDPETINVVFRAVHSIKGGAGAFGLDDLVHFAHRFETAMDEVRTGRFQPDPAALKIFFQCADILADLVRAARDDESIGEDVTGPVLAALEAMVGMEEEVEEEIDFAPMTLSLDLGAAAPMDLPDLDAAAEIAPIPGALPDLAAPQAAAPSGLPDLSALPPLVDAVDDPIPETSKFNIFEVHFTPEDTLYSSGNEPIYLFRTLRDLGDVHVTCETARLPSLETLNPDSAHLSWRLTITTEETEAAVREVFDFVDGLCTLNVTHKSQPAAIAAPLDSGLAPLTLEQPEPAPAAPAAIPSTNTLPPLAAAPIPPAPIAAPALPEITPEAAPAKAAASAAVEPTEAKAVSKPAPAAKLSEPKTSNATQPRATVRVDLERIDRLVNLVGELVINQAMLSQSVTEAGFAPNSPVATGLEEFMQLTRDIQESVMMIRAQPIKSLFQRMARIIREASSAVSKEVRLNTDGENTEVDKTVIERLADPLTHMIRNAVDHGLESTEDRLAAGKSAEGHVSLSAKHRSGRIVIEVADDGGGINRPKVRQIAIEKGLIPADAQLTDSDIDSLLFLPGFSTASEISNLSGRGVGMDVVRSSIQSLGGRIAITSTPGVGTTFSISLPLTLAVLDGMVVRVAGETLVVPLTAILETLTLTEEDLRTLGPSTHVVQIRGGFVPLLDLGAELGYRGPKESYLGGIVLLIGQEDGNRAALVVDAIEDQRQVVIKGLEASYGRVPGIAAATILGDGQIALILDPVDLVTQASGNTRKIPTNLSLAG